METTKQVTVENVNFRDPAERALFNKQQEALFAERKQSIIAGLKRDGLLDEKGCFVFDQPLPDDMQPDSLADFEHQMITMLVVAGPPGSGKSSVLRPAGKMAYFNADERARELNKGQGHGISREIRSVVNRQLEEFINGHIQAATSFSYETTLRTPITFEQARVAKLHGFETQMDYVALGSADESIARVRARSVQGGHSAPPERIREIYESSMKNLSRAINEFDTVRVYDNSDRVGREAPTLVLESVEGRVVGLVAAVPDWTVRALQGTAYDISRLLRRKNDITSLGPGY